MKRYIHLFIRYETTDTDEIISKMLSIHISEIPRDIRAQYQEDRDLIQIIRWYINARFGHEIKMIYSLSVVNEFDDFIYNSI